MSWIGEERLCSRRGGVGGRRGRLKKRVAQRPALTRIEKVNIALYNTLYPEIDTCSGSGRSSRVGNVMVGIKYWWCFWGAKV